VALIVALSGPVRLAPISAVLAAGAYQLVASLGLRYLVRLYLERSGRSNHDRSHPTLIFGAGEAGAQIVKALQNDPTSDFEPVAFLDDDRTKRRLILNGLRVVGTQDDIADAAASHSADTLLIAVPTLATGEMAPIADAAQAAGLAVKVLPSMHSIISKGLRSTDIRSIQMADFLGRDEISIDDGAVREYLRGKKVLVTGAGGSIGSELCRQIHNFEPAVVVMLDHDENALHGLQLGLEGRALLDAPNLVLCDIRDEDAVNAVFEKHQPDVVFHTAAHKHVTFLERFPAEGVKTNVMGTSNLLRAARANGVERFINISTDKAADPSNVLGTTKRIAERITSEADAGATGTYMSVRFGNVLGSNGSVIPTFAEQIRRGEPVTVTDPEATRYFMTVNEAVLLVLQSGALGQGADVLVLDMGEPVKIIDLPPRIAAEITPGEPPPRIVITGLRPGEKLHEQLNSNDDVRVEKPHDRVDRFVVPPLDITSVALDLDAEADELRDTLDAAARIVRIGVVIDLGERSAG
jgi:FlaA1/EpsC-like NDP-sugar epimerase